MEYNKITTCIWFSDNNGDISNLISYYKNIFETNIEVGEIISLGETPSGYSEMCEMKIFGQNYSIMNTAKEHHSLNDSISFVINCEDQDEIDKYWDYFTKEGEESECGWCIDKFGLRWQIIPKNLGELMNFPNGWETMMNQKKILINEYLK